MIFRELPGMSLAVFAKETHKKKDSIIDQILYRRAVCLVQSLLFQDPSGINDPSAFIHDTSGRGLPAVPQRRRRFSPSRMITDREALL